MLLTDLNISNSYSEMTMKKQPLISVIVASYNYERYIKETLDSLIGQTNKHFEIIVVDDGSKDQSLQVINEYKNRYKNIKLYTHPNNQNRGLAESLKLGIEKSTGEYIAFCESDDCWTSNHVECLHKAICNHPSANLIANGIKVINLSNNSDYDAYIKSCSSFLKKHSGSNIFPYLSSNYLPTFSAVCVKKEVIQQAHFDTPCPAWLDFWLWRQICIFNKVYYIPKAITLWRKHDESYDAISDNKDFDGFTKSSDQYLVSKYGLSQIMTSINASKDKKGIKWLINQLQKKI